MCAACVLFVSGILGDLWAVCAHRSRHRAEAVYRVAFARSSPVTRRSSDLHQLGHRWVPETLPWLVTRHFGIR